MKKLLLIAMVALSTLAWAKGKDHFQSQRGGNDWYNQHLTVQVDQFVRLNQTANPSATEQFSAGEPAAFQQPSSMAARQGGGGVDWYNQKVTIASGVNRRDLTALKAEPQLEKNSRRQTH